MASSGHLKGMARVSTERLAQALAAVDPTLNAVVARNGLASIQRRRLGTEKSRLARAKVAGRTAVHDYKAWEKLFDDQPSGVGVTARYKMVVKKFKVSDSTVRRHFRARRRLAAGKNKAR